MPCSAWPFGAGARTASRASGAVFYAAGRVLEQVFFETCGCVARFICVVDVEAGVPEAMGMDILSAKMLRLFEVCSLFLFGPPARRAARRGRLWGFAPFSAPLASPPKHPLQVFSYRAFARAARFLLRELPSLRSGDLPARRAMPPCALALHEGRGASASLGDATERQQLVPCW